MYIHFKTVDVTVIIYPKVDYKNVFKRAKDKVHGTWQARSATQQSNHVEVEQVERSGRMTHQPTLTFPKLK